MIEDLKGVWRFEKKKRNHYKDEARSYTNWLACSIPSLGDGHTALFLAHLVQMWWEGPCEAETKDIWWFLCSMSSPLLLIPASMMSIFVRLFNEMALAIYICVWGFFLFLKQRTWIHGRSAFRSLPGFSTESQMRFIFRMLKWYSFNVGFTVVWLPHST